MYDTKLFQEITIDLDFCNNFLIEKLRSEHELLMEANQSKHFHLLFYIGSLDKENHTNLKEFHHYNLKILKKDIEN